MVQYALDVLKDDPNRVKPFLTDIFSPVMGGIFGFGCMCFVNAATRRPLLSGIQMHAFSVAVGTTIGYYVDGYRNDHMAERDATLRYYVETHPEDFPDPERKTFAQVFEPWAPIR